jgi:hypothetical protein
MAHRVGKVKVERHWHAIVEYLDVRPADTDVLRSNQQGSGANGRHFDRAKRDDDAVVGVALQDNCPRVA